jgi:hypothetical protein
MLFIGTAKGENVLITLTIVPSPPTDKTKSNLLGFTDIETLKNTLQLFFLSHIAILSAIVLAFALDFL